MTHIEEDNFDDKDDYFMNLMDMEYTLEEVCDAIDNCGKDEALFMLIDFIKAARVSKEADATMDRRYYVNAVGSQSHLLFTSTSINTGPRGALRLAQGVQAVIRVGSKWLIELSQSYLNPDLSRALLVAIVNDIRASMLEEVEFKKEATNIEAFKGYLESMGLTRRATAPRVYPECSTKKYSWILSFPGVILGSVERMFAILLEHYKGKWPFWLSPRQTIICHVFDKSLDYGQEVKELINATGYYVDIVSFDKTIQKKVREAQLAQYNYILVVGEVKVNSKYESRK
ncbi:threonine--tRNA ligase, mitochondrial 1-like protein [Tanacetum coccineum]